MIQVDTLCHKIPNFIEKAKRAGVTRVFIGLENINPDNLAAAKKRQNKITEYRKMLLAWKAQGIMTLAGYILGFPADTPETIRRDIEIIQKELPLDVLEFFCLTPLPGSEDHQTLWRNGVAMEPDLNKYDVEHVCTAHARMSTAGVGGDLSPRPGRSTTPRRTWRRCCAAPWPAGVPLASLVKVLVNFATTVRLENVHPLQGGILRLKHPSERRPGLPVESPLVFWPRFVWETVRKQAILIGTIGRFVGVAMAIRRSPGAHAYTDEALTPVSEDDDATLDLMTVTTGGRAAVAHGKKVAALAQAPRPTGHRSGASPVSWQPVDIPAK